jgi:hypothetical protein
MKLSAKKLLALLVLSGLIVGALSGVALASPPWSDASASWWVTNYGVTETEVATVADGFPDGTFRPSAAVTRGQFAKMAISGLGVETAHPASATFADVIPSNPLYEYVEGAYAADLIGGYPSGGGLLFKPGAKITRQQANSILGRYLSKLEIDITGSIHGDVTTYGTLELWYNAEGSFYLNGFSDASKVATNHKPATAYLIFRKIVEGSNSRLNPTATLNRAQAAAMVLRVKAEADNIKTPPGAPANLAVLATPGGDKTVTYNSTSKQYVGNDPTPQITGDTLAGRPIAVYDAGTKIVEDTSNSAGKFYTDITTALSDGTHSFTAKVKNENGLVSAASPAVTYLLDTIAPTATVTKPASGAIGTKPDFTATVSDAAGGTGVKQVEFQCALKQVTPTWQTVSIDMAPDAGTSNYSAVWPSSGTLASGLSDGQYQFRVIATDNAGNQRTSSVVEATVDTAKPTVTIITPVSSGIYYTEDSSPTFTATATDPGQGSGIASVQFYYAPYSDSKPTSWAGFTLISTDTTADYAATWGTNVLPEGHYILAVKAIDTLGNETALMNGSSYAAGVTQEIIVDATAPVVTITSPIAGQVFYENQVVAITWTLKDATPPTIVSIEYTLDSSVVAPAWIEVPGATATANDGRFDWTTPEIDANKDHVRIRITARDQAGPLVGDTIGHTTVALSGQFVIDDTAGELPPGVTSLVASDPDTVESGVNGFDFHAVWVLSTSPDIESQKVYILPYDVNFLDLGAHVPVATIGNTVTSWTGNASITKDSAGHTLVVDQYRIWIMVTDTRSRSNLTKSAVFQVIAE